MILLSLQGIQKSFGTNQVLRDASLVLQEGQRMGLVGVNGCGKSTLMKIIAGLESSDGGVITMQKGLRLGYLAQQGMVDENKTVLEEMESVFEPVVRMETQLRALEHQMADAVQDEALLHRLGSQYDQLTRDFERSNGFGWRSTVQGVLAGLGFRKEQQEQKARLLSGGERTRLCLARMLLTQPDLLLMDDVQFLSNKVQMQEQFFHTFETLFQAGKQIVLTSDRPPKEIATLNERLRTRFESGLLADIQSPDLETRMAMIKAKAAATGIQLPQKVVAYIAENITNNVRELEGAVKKIAAIHTLMDRPIDMELAQEAIRDIFKEKPGLHPTPEMILKEVAEYFAIEQSRLVSKARSKDIVVPRQVACYLMRDIGGMSYPEIGKVFGQHHTSIIYGVEKLTSAMAQDEQLKNKISDLQKNITEQ